ncbi:MAG TPA: glycosyltransferase family A protein, partial [Chthoniobacteraceae bacterium]
MINDPARPVRPELTVILCTHNPRADYLEQTLAALRAQTLATEGWELLLVDNASTHAVADRCDLTWHPNARAIREDRLGLTMARTCGFRAAQTDVLVLVDDDNLLAPNYLTNALNL